MARVRYTVFNCVPYSTVISLCARFTFNCLIQSNECRSYSNKTVNQLYNYSTVLAAAINVWVSKFRSSVIAYYTTKLLRNLLTQALHAYKLPMNIVGFLLLLRWRIFSAIVRHHICFSVWNSRVSNRVSMGRDVPGQKKKILSRCFRTSFSCFRTTFSFLEHHFPVLEHHFLLCLVLSRVSFRILAVLARPVPNFGCPGPSCPLVRFLACPVVPLSRDKEETSVPLSRKVALSHPVGNPNVELHICFSCQESFIHFTRKRTLADDVCFKLDRSHQL